MEPSPVKIGEKKLSVSSDYVKSVEFHPSEPWVLASLATGRLVVWDYESGDEVRSIEVSDSPVKCAKFVARNKWIVAACDDMHLHVFGYDGSDAEEKEAVRRSVRAHDGTVRWVEVHPDLPYLLTCSDDGGISLWDWDRDFDRRSTFDGHSQDVTMVRFNPWDANSFASSSLDGTVKLWDIRSKRCSTLAGHEAGVICVDYGLVGNVHVVLSASDDHTVALWDYITRSRVRTFDVHNVRAALCHPKFQVVMSASEEGSILLHSRVTTEAATTLGGSMGPARALAAPGDSNLLAIGYDQGFVVMELDCDSQAGPVSSPRPAEASASDNEQWLSAESSRLLPYLGIAVCSLLFCFFSTSPFVVIMGAYWLAQARVINVPMILLFVSKLRNIQGVAGFNFLVAFAMMDEPLLLIVAERNNLIRWPFALICVVVPEMFLLSRLLHSGLNGLLCLLWAFSLAVLLFILPGSVYVEERVLGSFLAGIGLLRWACICITQMSTPEEWGANARGKVLQCKRLFGVKFIASSFLLCKLGTGTEPTFFDIFLFIGGALTCSVLQCCRAGRSLLEISDEEKDDGGTLNTAHGMYQPPAHTAVLVEQLV